MCATQLPKVAILVPADSQAPGGAEQSGCTVLTPKISTA